MDDDILVFGLDKEELDLRLKSVLDCLQTAKVTLNQAKCVFKTKAR